MKKILLLSVLVTIITYGSKWSNKIDRVPYPPCENKLIVKMWYENNTLGSKRLYRMKYVKLENGSVWRTFDDKYSDHFKKGVRMNKECSLSFGYLGMDK